ncbi:MAG: hypothetical protein ACFCUN_10075 [Hyphomicrobiaceae bacterium]
MPNALQAGANVDASASQASRPPAIPPQTPKLGVLVGFGAGAKIGLFDDSGRQITRIEVASLPKLPANGLPYFAGSRPGFVRVVLDDRVLVLDEYEVTLKPDKPVVTTNCGQLVIQGRAPARQTPGSMGYGGC